MQKKLRSNNYLKWTKHWFFWPSYWSAVWSTPAYGNNGSRIPSTATQPGLIPLHLLVTPESKPTLPPKNPYLLSTEACSTLGQMERWSIYVDQRHISTRSSFVSSIPCFGRLSHHSIVRPSRTGAASTIALQSSITSPSLVATHPRLMSFATSRALTASPSTSTTTSNTIDCSILFEISANSSAIIKNFDKTISQSIGQISKDHFFNLKNHSDKSK